MINRQSPLLIVDLNIKEEILMMTTKGLTTDNSQDNLITAETDQEALDLKEVEAEITTVDHLMRETKAIDSKVAIETKEDQIIAETIIEVVASMKEEKKTLEVASIIEEKVALMIEEVMIIKEETEIDQAHLLVINSKAITDHLHKEITTGEAILGIREMITIEVVVKILEEMIISKEEMIEVAEIKKEEVIIEVVMIETTEEVIEEASVEEVAMIEEDLEVIVGASEEEVDQETLKMKCHLIAHMIKIRSDRLLKVLCRSRVMETMIIIRVMEVLKVMIIKTQEVKVLMINSTRLLLIINKFISLCPQHSSKIIRRLKQPNLSIFHQCLINSKIKLMLNTELNSKRYS